MDLKLSERSKEFIQEKLKLHQFDSSDNVVEAALRLMEINEKFDDEIDPKLLKELQEALDSLNRGEGTVYDNDSLKELFEKIKAKGKRNKNLVAT